MNRRTRRPAGLALVTLALLAACGGQDSTPPDAAGATPQGTPHPKAARPRWPPAPGWPCRWRPRPTRC
jgi:hypothetical protein